MNGYKLSARAAATEIRYGVSRSVAAGGVTQLREGPDAVQVVGDGWTPMNVPLNWWQMGVTPPEAARSSMVEACVSAYAQTVAMCPGNHWRWTADEGRKRVDNSPLARIIKRPNDYQTISDFLLNLVRYLLDEGNAYANSADGQIDFTVGEPGLNRAFIGQSSGTSPTEPDSPFYYAWTPYRGPPFGLTGTGVSIAADQIILTATGGWTSGTAYSTSGYTSGSGATFRAGDGHGGDIMAGLTGDPTASASYDTIDYAWYLVSNGNAYIYENGAQAINVPTAVEPAVYVYGFGYGIFAVRYNNRKIQYVYNDVIYREIDAPENLTLYFRAALAGQAGVCRLSGVDFASVGSVGKDGSSGLTAYLTNETFTQPTNAAGAPEAIANGIGDGQMRVFLGTQDVTAQCTFTAQLPFNLYVTIDGAGNYTATNLSGDTGYAFIVASYNGQAISKRLSASRSRGGTDGSSPPLVTISTTHHTFRYDTNGAVAAQTTRISALPQNSTGAVQWQLLKSDGTPLIGWTDAPSFAATGAASRHLDYLTIEIDADRFAAVIAEHATPALIYEVRLASTPGVTDRVSIARIADGAKGADGAAGLAVYLTNPSHTVPATPTGAVTSYAGSDFTVVVMAGGENVTGWFALEGTENPQALSVPGTYPNYYVNDGLDAYEATATLKLNLLGSGRFDGVRLSTVYSLAKSIAGANGESPPLLTVQASALAIITNPDGSLVTNAAMTFSATRQNTDAPVAWAVLDGAGIHHRNYDGLSFTTDAADLLAIINYPAAIGQPNTRFATVRATCAGITDFVTVWAVRNGSNGANGTSPFALDLGSYVVVVNATYNGITKPGQLPRNVAVSVKQGTTDMLGAVAIGVSTSSGVAANYANGIVSITQINADGYVEVSASKDGVNLVAPKRIAVSRNLDAPPPQTATGQTIKGGNGNPDSTSFPAFPSGLIATVEVPASGQMPILVYADYSVVANYSVANQTYAAQFKVVYRPAGGGGAWSDLVPGISGTTASWSRSTEEYETGEASYSQNVSMPGGTTFEFALMIRKLAGNAGAQGFDATMRIGV